MFRRADEPNEVFVVLEWDDLQNARNFFQSPDRGPAMERAGVTKQPDIYFLEQADRPSA